MDDYMDDSVRLPEGPVADAERIKSIAMQKLNIMPKKKVRRIGRTLLIAAAAAVALGGTALAVYHLTLADRVAEYTTLKYVNADPITESYEVVGVTGDSESPETLAWAEWKAWSAEWHKENTNWYSDRGLDDSYTETQENYAYIYDAPLQEQAEALDAIAEKYGLQLLEKKLPVTDAETLYGLLGTEAFLPEGTEIGGILYNNGSMNMDNSFPGSGPGFYLTVNVRNSFLNVGGLSAERLGEGEEWNYTTQSGVSVELILFDTRAMILADFENAALTLTVYRGRTGDDLHQVAEEFSSLYCIDRAGVEELADSLALDVLAERYAEPFDIGEALEAASETVPEEELPEISEYGEINEWIEPWESSAAQDELIFGQLGLYDPSELPAKLQPWFTTSYLAGDAENGRVVRAWMICEDLDTKTDFDLFLRYEPAENFSCYAGEPVWADNGALVSPGEKITGWDAALEFFSSMAAMNDCAVEEQSVSGWDGRKMLRPDGATEALIWHDEDAGLVFWMTNNIPDMSADEFLAIAESMEKQ